MPGAEGRRRIAAGHAAISTDQRAPCIVQHLQSPGTNHLALPRGGRGVIVLMAA